MKNEREPPLPLPHSWTSDTDFTLFSFLGESRMILYASGDLTLTFQYFYEVRRVCLFV